MMIYIIIGPDKGQFDIEYEHRFRYEGVGVLVTYTTWDQGKQNKSLLCGCYGFLKLLGKVRLIKCV